MAPFYKTVDEEVESAHLRFLQQPTGMYRFILIKGCFDMLSIPLIFENTQIKSHKRVDLKVKHEFTELSL